MDIGLSEDYCESMADSLGGVLADTYALMLKTQNYHWNLKGKHFRDLHLMFEEQYGDLWEAVDMIAERIQMLDGTAPGSFSEFNELSNISSADSKLNADDMTRDLLEDHERMLREIRNVLEDADEGGDDGTVDMLTERIREHEQTSWMLRSRLE